MVLLMGVYGRYANSTIPLDLKVRYAKVKALEERTEMLKVVKMND